MPVLSTISFPSAELEPAAPSPPPPNPSFLPFRRISLPTTPSALYRRSITSLVPFNSEFGDGGAKAPNQLGGPRGGARRVRKREILKPIDETLEAKRRKVILELLETERAYVDGLDLIYNHFLTPIITSLDTDTPLLTRAELNAIFANFIDIWNMHRSFYSSLSFVLNSYQTCSASELLPPISSVLLSHFPYLSLYTLFITSFPASLEMLNSLLSSTSPISRFIQTQQCHPCCMRLSLRDWLLTIVQRCPRYLLLLKDLIRCTAEGDPESGRLKEVYALVTKITVSLDASLASHTLTLTLLSLQRRTANLPASFYFISPGRTFEKRGEIVMLDERGRRRRRELLLFSDCLIWLERVGGNVEDEGLRAKGQEMVRNRSKSEAALLLPRAPTKSNRHSVNPANDEPSEFWEYIGSVWLIDVEVVVPRQSDGSDPSLEILSPEGSFVLCFALTHERDAWSDAMRSGKNVLLVRLHSTHPHSTLVSSASTQHLRRALQALPEAGGPPRAQVDHWVPAIWTPDAKAAVCMRCGRPFGWRSMRRRHHCRLCGRCVCAGCSGRTFFITDPSVEGCKAARACEECYETVFPPLAEGVQLPADAEVSHATSSLSLSGFPSWFTLTNAPSDRGAEALMAMRATTPLTEVGVNGAREARRRVRQKEPSRPRSSCQILEDFQNHVDGMDDVQFSGNRSASQCRNCSPDLSELSGNTLSLSRQPGQAREVDGTATWLKRFSMPAVSLQTTNVLVQTGGGACDAVSSGESVGVSTDEKGKRFSLVIGRSMAPASGGIEGGLLGKGVAANRLGQLLGRPSRDDRK